MKNEKKNYNQPMVETAEIYAISLMQAASSGLPINQTPIEDNAGGD